MQSHEIGIWFLLLGLIFPRITLFFWWICGNLPFHTTPLIANLFASVLVPRILITVWIYSIQGFSPWFWYPFISNVICISYWCITINKQYVQKGLNIYE